MMAWMMAAAALEGDAALEPVAAVGTAFRGDDASRTGAAAVTWGVLLHLSLGAILGVVFSAIVPRDMPLPSSMMLGAGSALFWLGLVVQIIPRVAPILDSEMPRHGGAWVVAHAAFGAVLGIAPWLQRRMGERAGRRAGPGRPGVLHPRTSS
jgi:hypothetical protein